jgi:hypothetical protein
MRHLWAFAGLVVRAPLLASTADFERTQHHRRHRLRFLVAPGVEDARTAAAREGRSHSEGNGHQRTQTPVSGRRTPPCPGHATSRRGSRGLTALAST